MCLYLCSYTAVCVCVCECVLLLFCCWQRAYNKFITFPLHAQFVIIKNVLLALKFLIIFKMFCLLLLSITKRTHEQLMFFSYVIFQCKAHNENNSLLLIWSISCIQTNTYIDTNVHTGSHESVLIKIKIHIHIYIFVSCFVCF